jgi:serine/threonine protein kinase
MGDAARSNEDLHQHGELVLEPGALVLDKYRLSAPRGSGSMGTVWSAVHVTLGHGVAIKLLAGQARNSADSRQRFEREARIAARLGEDSPHIARVIDYGIFAGSTPCLVMELLHGEELSVRLKRVGRMSLPSTALIVHQLCRALSVAHAAGVVHRDIKPSNVFLCPVGGSDRLMVKLMDFGIAKATRDGSEEETTRVGMVVGTPAYMSPEQVLAQREIDARTDLWSLGAMIYRMVTGTSAFGQGGFGEIGVRILAVEPKPPSHVVPTLPRAFDDFIRKAMAKDPNQRFQTTDELAAALSAVAEVRQNELDTTTMRALKNATTLSPTMPPPAVDVDSLMAIPLVDTPTQATDRPASARNGSGVRRMIARRSRGAVWAALAASVLVMVAVFGRVRSTRMASSTHVQAQPYAPEPPAIPTSPPIATPAPATVAKVAVAPSASTTAPAALKPRPPKLAPPVPLHQQANDLWKKKDEL